MMEYIEHPLDVSPCSIEGFVLFSMFDVGSWYKAVFLFPLSRGRMWQLLQRS